MQAVGAGLEMAKTVADLVRTGGLRAIVELLRVQGTAVVEVGSLVAALPDLGHWLGSCPRSPIVL